MYGSSVTAMAMTTSTAIAPRVSTRVSPPGSASPTGRDVRVRSWLPTASRHSSASPSATSMTAPAVIRPFSPRSGMPTCAANTTPTIEPSVFAAYTAPIDRSPWPAASSA